MKKVFILFVTIVCFSFFQIKHGYSQSNNVSLLGKWMNTNYSKAVYVYDIYAYVSSQNIMNILDISNPESIIGKGQYTSPSNISRIFVYDDYAYIAAGNSGLRIVDISNPMQPTETGFYNTEGLANGVIVSGNYAYIAADTSGLRIIDISNPSLPTEVGFINLESSKAVDVTLAGNYVFIK